jgi:hypothetical protein
MWILHNACKTCLPWKWSLIICKSLFLHGLNALWCQPQIKIQGPPPHQMPKMQVQCPMWPNRSWLIIDFHTLYVTHKAWGQYYNNSMHTIMHTCACLEFGVQNFLDKSQEIKILWSCPPHPYCKKKKRTFWYMTSKSYFLVLYAPSTNFVKEKKPHAL